MPWLTGRDRWPVKGGLPQNLGGDGDQIVPNPGLASEYYTDGAPAGFAGNEERPAGAEVAIGRVQGFLIVGREIADESEAVALQVQFEQAVAVIAPSRGGIEWPFPVATYTLPSLSAAGPVSLCQIPLSPVSGAVLNTASCRKVCGW